MGSEPDVPADSVVAAAPSDGAEPIEAGDRTAEESHDAANAGPSEAPAVPTIDRPVPLDDQATMLDVRREHLSNGTGNSRMPLQGQAAAEPIAHDAATYQDTPAGAAPAWRAPSAPPYVPPPPAQPRPRGSLPTPRSHAPWRTAQSWGPTTFTVSADTAAGFSYLLWWLSGLTVYFAERNNRYVRFHALQSILLTSVFTVLAVLAFVLDALLHDLTSATHWTVFGTLGSGVAILVVVLGVVVPWLGTMIGAWTGHHIRWPIVGAYAERYAAPPLQVPGTPFR